MPGMPVLGDQPVRFIHVPKTGGENFQKLITGSGALKNHSTATDQQFDGRQPRPFVVTIVRNPYDRVWSWFKFCIHGDRRQLPGPERFCEPALDAFLTAADRLGNRTAGWSDAALLHSWQQALRQWTASVGGFMRRPVGRRAASRIDQSDVARLSMVDFLVHRPSGHFAADFVLRFERYENDLAGLFACFGPPWDTLNASRTHEHSSSGDATRTMQPAAGRLGELYSHLSSLERRRVFTSATRDWVHRWFGADFDFFGYAREEAEA